MLAGLATVAVLIAVALAAPLLAMRDPLATSALALAPPSAQHWMGTDNLGRDVWSGVVYGSRVSLLVGITASLVSTAIALAIGSVAGYRGGTVDVVLMRFAEFVQIIPQFFLALIMVALLGRGLGKVILVLGIVGWPLAARIVRAQFLALKGREYAEAARAVGAGDWYIGLRVILPNALPPIVVTATQAVSLAILLESGISFFGLGDPSLVSWGQMLNTAQQFLYVAWWMSVFPGLAVIAAVLGFSLLGDGINDVLNPRSMSRKA